MTDIRGGEYVNLGAAGLELLRKALIGDVRRGPDHVAFDAGILGREFPPVLLRLLDCVVRSVPRQLAFVLGGLIERLFRVTRELCLREARECGATQQGACADGKLPPRDDHGAPPDPWCLGSCETVHSLLPAKT